MAYDETTAGRIRQVLKGRRGVAERRMFGGLAFMINGHMAVGVLGDSLVLRLGDEGTCDALREPHTAPMDFTGKPLKSMIYVRPAGHRTEAMLRRWIARASDFVGALPKKR